MRWAALAVLLACACRSSQPQPAVASGSPAAASSPEELDRKGWKFAAYFTRIKQAVRAKWKPQDTWRRIDPDGKKYGPADRYTLVHVRLWPDGTVADLFVEKSSGIPLLDNLAVRAFREAAPFPAAPPQLVETRSRMVDFRFGFYLDMDGNPGPLHVSAGGGAHAATSADGGVAASNGHADDGGQARVGE
jgi:TonB family protein